MTGAWATETRAGCPPWRAAQGCRRSFGSAPTPRSMPPSTLGLVPNSYDRRIGRYPQRRGPHRVPQKLAPVQHSIFQNTMLSSRFPEKRSTSWNRPQNPCRRLNVLTKAERRKRIFARLREGWPYDEIAARSGSARSGFARSSRKFSPSGSSTGASTVLTCSSNA
jgi:hypothetical protein